MKTREEIFDVYLDFYSSDIKVKKIINPFYIFIESTFKLLWIEKIFFRCK